MTFLGEIDAHAERVVRGEAPAGGDPALAEMAAFAAELRALYAHPPSDEARERHLTAIIAETAATRSHSLATAGRKRSRVAAWIPTGRRGPAIAVRAAAAGLAALAATAGLAIAGVGPPAPLDSAFERIGIGPGGDDGTPPPANGDGGPAGAAQGSDGAAHPARDGSPDRDRGSAAGVTRGEPGARGKGDERRSPTGTANSEPGRATAEEARGGGTPPQSPGRSGERRPEGAGPPTDPGVHGQAQGRPQAGEKGRGGDASKGDPGAQGRGGGGSAEPGSSGRSADGSNPGRAVRP